LSVPNEGGVAAFARRAFTENLSLKSIALVASLVLFVMRGGEDQTGVVSPRVIAPERAGFVLVSDVPEQVHITLTGSRALVNSVRQEPLEDIRIPHDTEERFFYIEASQIDLPPGVSVSSIEPTAIPLVWAERGERRFRVDPVIDGEVAEGFVQIRTAVEPTVVVVRGAATELTDITRVHTQPIDVAGLTAGEHELRVPLMPLARHLEYSRSGSVTVTVTVEAEAGHRLLEDVEVAVVGGTELDLRPGRVNVSLRGPRARVDDLHPRRVIPFVDVSGFDPAMGAVPLQVRLRPLPEDIAVTVEPAEVLVLPRTE